MAFLAVHDGGHASPSWVSVSGLVIEDVIARRAGSPVSAPVSVGGTSSPFEVALQLPVGDAQVVEDDLFLHGGVQQVLEDEVAEDLARDA